MNLGGVKHYNAHLLGVGGKSFTATILLNKNWVHTLIPGRVCPDRICVLSFE